MLRKFNMYRAILVCCIFISTAAFAFADTVRLKDGSIIKGKIVSFDGGKFTVLIDDGTRQRTLTYTAAEVESIIFDSGTLPLLNSTNTRSTNTDGNTTIIQVGQTKPEGTIPSVSNGKNTSKNDPSTMIKNEKSPVSNIPDTNIGTAKPITINISVLADNTTNGWTNSGWVVRKGQKIKIIGSGRVSLGNGRYASPTGITTLSDYEKLMKDQPTGCLIAVIGADNNEFIFVGKSLEFTATRDGDLFLGVNEGNLGDNSGSFEVTIEIDPNIGS